jgi:hypothetical protein
MHNRRGGRVLESEPICISSCIRFVSIATCMGLSSLPLVWISHIKKLLIVFVNYANALNFVFIA